MPDATHGGMDDDICDGISSVKERRFSNRRRRKTKTAVSNRGSLKLTFYSPLSNELCCECAIEAVTKGEQGNLVAKF
jgi:hypothetical protein